MSATPMGPHGSAKFTTVGSVLRKSRYWKLEAGWKYFRIGPELSLALIGNDAGLNY